MNNSNLTREQALQVFLETREMLGRIYRLKARMEERGFPPEDQLYQATEAAWMAFIEMNTRWQRIATGNYGLSADRVGKGGSEAPKLADSYPVASPATHNHTEVPAITQNGRAAI